MSTAEVSNKNTLQIPYIDRSVALSVSEKLSRIGTPAIFAEYRSAVEQDPKIIPFLEARLRVTQALGISGRMTDDGRPNYGISPEIDYISGAVLARSWLTAQYEANGGSLPAAEVGAETDLIKKMEGQFAEGAAEYYPAQISHSLATSGCGEAILNAITDPRVPVIKQIGALEMLAFYAEQPVAPVTADSVDLLAR